MHPICTALGAHIRGAVFQEHFQGEILRAPLNWKKESLSYHFGLLPVVKSESESHSVVSDSLQPPGLYSPWGRKEWNTTERLSFSLSIYLSSVAHLACLTPKKIIL